MKILNIREYSTSTRSLVQRPDPGAHSLTHFGLTWVKVACSRAAAAAAECLAANGTPPLRVHLKLHSSADSVISVGLLTGGTQTWPEQVEVKRKTWHETMRPFIVFNITLLIACKLHNR